MKITRFYATEDGESRFDEIEIPIANARENEGQTAIFSNGILSTALRFVEPPELRERFRCRGAGPCLRP